MRRACLATRQHGRITPLSISPLSAGSGSDQRRVETAFASLACLLLASCGHSRTTAAVVTPPPALPAVPSSPPAATPPSAAASAIAAAVAAYRSYWDDAVYANARAGYWNDTTRASLGTSGSLYTLFAQHAVGSAFEQQRVSVYKADKLGHFSVGAPALHPIVLAASSSAAPMRIQLQDCLDDTHWLVHLRRTGALADNKPGGRHPLVATLTRTAEGWKVTDLVNRPGQGTC